ncbi:hypothetical protein [Paraburkholderia acidiphila]|uniref:Uncharacterized protein n=1 Tax=Paraburkholderia acidiphila TaxID=2571747 RepID=A0A7Z2G308_9BURK|nr:hypothetical protein [Paraburkholderia acidiphila]QGZ54303.1 hypothetical protein FAZ97_04875 [Paraburkholderia acidiphila]
MRRLSSDSIASPLVTPLRLVPVGPARTIPIDVLIPDAGGMREPAREARVQLFERVRESGTHVDYCVVVTPIGADQTAFNDFADQLTGDDPDELVDLALSGVLFARADELDDESEDTE